MRPKLGELVNDLFKSIPSGVGSKGAVRLTQSELDEVLVKGVSWAIDNGYGTNDDADVCVFEEDEHKLLNLKPFLNKYGYESKKLYESLYADRRGEEDFEERMSIFNESEITKQIRSLDDGLIIYGHGLEPREDFDMQSTFNRASLKIKTVTKYGDVFNDLIEEDNNLERENAFERSMQKLELVNSTDLQSRR